MRYTPPLWGRTPSLLARMRAELLEPVPAGEPVAVVGWSLAADPHLWLTHRRFTHHLPLRTGPE